MCGFTRMHLGKRLGLLHVTCDCARYDTERGLDDVFHTSKEGRVAQRTS